MLMQKKLPDIVRWLLCGEIKGCPHVSSIFFFFYQSNSYLEDRVFKIVSTLKFSHNKNTPLQVTKATNELGLGDMLKSSYWPPSADIFSLLCASSERVVIAVYTLRDSLSV